MRKTLSTHNYILKRLDHVVITTPNPTEMASFYHSVLGMDVDYFGPDKKRLALKFGHQKINLHTQGKEFSPHAEKPTPGSQDLCFITDVPLQAFMQKVQTHGISIEEGPVERTGAMGGIHSFYIRDPDRNLIEIANYPKKTGSEEAFFYRSMFSPLNSFRICFSRSPILWVGLSIVLGFFGGCLVDGYLTPL